ncbi:MAG: aldolase/citrate lyase family protein [Bacteroidales bacterium]
MRTNFRKRLLNKEPMIGTLLTISGTEAAEILSKSGFDWLFIDMEHSAIGLHDAQLMIQAASPNAHCIVRVPGKDEIWIKRVLDIGAEGIIVPQVNTPQEARQVVNFAQYPPEGKRSAGIAKAQGFGTELNQYIENANKDIAIITQCEHKDGVKNLPEIVSIEGIDCIFIGPYDLSGSFNKLGKIDDPEVQEAIETIKKTCHQADMATGIFGTQPDALKEHKKTGISLLALSTDSLMLSGSARQLLNNMKSSSNV